MNKITKIHRRFPEHGWDYKALSTRVRNNGKVKEIIFHKLRNKGKKSVGVEIFSGSNYVVGSSDRSYSKGYPISRVPKKYKAVVRKLMTKHKKTKWSKRKFMNLN